MKVWGYLILCLFYAGVSSVPAEKKTGKHSQLALTCLDGRFEVSPSLFESLKPCNDDQTYPEEKKACQFYCQAGILDLLDGQGLPDKQRYYKFTQTSVQLGYETKAFRHFSDCFKFANNIDLEDETCKSVKEFSDCTWQIASSPC